MQSQWAIGGTKYMALAIDDRRHGPDAGPWETIQSFSVDADELIKAAKKAKSSDGDSHGQ